MRYVNMMDVAAGMKVAKAILNENGDILVHANVILTEPLIQQMRKRELTGIYIEDALSEDIFLEELISEETERKAVKALQNLDIDAAMDVAELIVDEISDMSEISLDMSGLRSKSNSTYEHSIDVSIYAVMIGIGMGMRKGLLKELAVSALLHDIGKLQIPTKLLHKPGKLTPEEYEEMKKHSEYGYELLKDNVMLTSKIKMGVYMHHENVDGTGYPLGLEGDQIYLFAKIIHIADVYDAICSKRSYKQAQLPTASAEFLMQRSGTMFQPELVRVFLDCLPLYPKGRTVILNNNEKAIVVENRQFHTARPVVRYFDGVTVDLSEEENDDLEIVGIMA